MTIAWLQCNTTTLPPDWQAELKDGDIALFSDGRELDPAQFQVDDVWEPGTLARISHANQRIGAPNQRELLCRNDFRRFEGEPRCRQSVARKYLILEPWKVALWKLHLTLDWSRRTRERCFWERPIGRLI
jgi:hypothetical protein